jgi:hypothetical protein
MGHRPRASPRASPRAHGSRRSRLTYHVSQPRQKSEQSITNGKIHEIKGEKKMPNTQTAVNHHEYRSVPVAALIESASNPRKRFDDKSLEELAASFKTQGSPCSALGAGIGAK